MNRIIIAIDGHSSCGKSTMAKQLAKEIGYIYVDTGAMYRAVTLYAMRHGLYPEEGIRVAELQKIVEAGQINVGFRFDAVAGRPETLLNGEVVEDEIRQMAVSSRVSPIAALPFVRDFLTRQQQALGLEKGIVMDGRDIGTVVFPQAELKVFVTASAAVRARRRYDELMAKAKTQAERDALSLEDIQKNVEERDYVDSHREVAPLRQAPDAVVLDNSLMTREEQNAWLLARYKEAVERC